MSLDLNPDQLEGTPLPVTEEEQAASVDAEIPQTELVAGEPQPEIIPDSDEQVAGVGRALREAGNVVKDAVTGSPRPPRGATAGQAAQDIEDVMTRVGDFTDPTQVDVTRWSSEYIDDVEDITNVLQGTHDQWDFESQHPALQRQPHRETLSKAAAMSEKDFATKVLRYKEGDAWNAAEITRGRQMMLNLASEIYAYAPEIGQEVTDTYGRKYWKVTTTDEAKLFELHKKLNTLAAVQYATEGVISEAGRALNSMKVRVGSAMADAGNLSDKYMRIGGVKSTEKLLNMVMNGDFEQMTKTAQAVKYQGFSGRTWGVIKDLYYFGMLSGISTQEKNIIGNALVSLNAVQEKYTSYVWGKALAPVDKAAVKLGDKTNLEWMKAWGTKSDAEKLHLEDANDFAIGTVSGYILAFKLLGKRLREGTKQMTHDAADIVGQGDKVFPDGGAEPNKVDIGHVAYDDAARIRGISAENVKLDPKSVQGKFVNFVGDYVTGSAGNMLGLMDDIFKTVAYEQSMMYETRRAARKVLGDDASDPDKLYPMLKEMRSNPDDFLHEKGIEFARHQTFTEDLDSSVGKLMQKAAAVPVVNVFVPFVRTVSNILKYGAERTFPVGFPSFWKDLAAGGEARDQAMGRLSTGAVMAGVASTMFMGESKEVIDPATGHKVIMHMPNFTGALSGNPQVRKMQMQAGMLPYSFRDPETGTYTPYTWVEPFGTMFGAMATMLETLHNTHDENKQQEIYEALVVGLADYTTDKSYLMGFADMLEIMQGEKSAGDFAAKFAGTIVVPNAIKNARKDVDPVIRGSKAGSWMERMVREIKNRSPWHSTEVPPYVSVWGEDLMYGDPMWKYHYISPTMTRRVTDDRLTQELAKLYRPNEEDANRFSVRTPTSAIQWLHTTPDGQTVAVKVDLNMVDTSGWAYSDYQKLVGKERRRMAESAVMGNLAEWEGLSMERKYMRMSTVFNDGVSKVRNHIATGRIETKEMGAFLQKYSDAIALEAERLYMEGMNFQGGQFDYLSKGQPTEGEPEQPVESGARPEF